MKIVINISSLIVTLMALMAFFVFVMIYSHLTYVAPVNMPEWRLPGIADGKFVLGVTITMVTAFFVLMFFLRSEFNKVN